MAYVKYAALRNAPRICKALSTFYIGQGRVKANAGPSAVPKCGPLANV